MSTFRRYLYVTCLIVLCAADARKAVAAITLVGPPSIAGTCEAHVVDIQGREFVGPCGAPIIVDVPKTAWVESEHSVSAMRSDISVLSNVRFNTVGPAGVVAFPPGRKFEEGERLRIVALTPLYDGSSRSDLFVRDVVSTLSDVRVPAGRVVALLLDSKERVITASRPISVAAGKRTLLWPEREAGSTVIAYLRRPQTVERDAEDALAVAAADTDRVHAPAAVVDGANATFAIWYGLTGTNARVIVESKMLRLPSDTVTLSRHSVSLLDETLRFFPSLAVTLGPAPRDASIPGPLTLTVARAMEDDKVLRTIAVKPGQTISIDSLPADVLIVGLEIGDFLLNARADLTSGENATLTIPLNPLKITGKVMLGDSPVRATLRFMQRGKQLEIETDDAGSYGVTLWQPARYVVEVLLPEREAPYSEVVNIRASETLDFRIPRNVLRVRLYDITDHTPIKTGEIVIHNRWTGASGQQSSVVSRAVTGVETVLPPQRIGSSEIRARASGYSDAGPIVVPVDESLGDRVVEIAMKRDESSAKLLVLMGGAPAVGAEMSCWTGDELIWRGSTDEAGTILVPENVTTRRVIVRHPAAASDVILLGHVSPGDRLFLQPAAPPLAIQVVRRDGTPIRGGAARITFIAGLRLSASEEDFRTWSTSATMPDGTSIIRGLAPRTLRILATRKASDQQIATGTFDGLATTVQFPWPVLVKVTLADE